MTKTHARALIFDCDGTLADTMPAHYQAWLQILQPHKIPFPEERFYGLGGVPTAEIARILLRDAGRDDLDAGSLTHAKEMAFVDVLESIRPIEKVLEIARIGRGVSPMAVASGGQRAIVERTLNHLRIREWFSAIVTAEDTTRHKPEPDVFLEAARRLGADPSICTVYEDTDLGLEAARRAGMVGVDIRKL